MLVLIISSVLMLVLLYFQYKANPELFSASNISRSLWTLGLLAIFLILVVGFMVSITDI